MIYCVKLCSNQILRRRKNSYWLSLFSGGQGRTSGGSGGVVLSYGGEDESAFWDFLRVPKNAHSMRF